MEVFGLNLIHFSNSLQSEKVCLTSPTLPQVLFCKMLPIFKVSTEIFEKLILFTQVISPDSSVDELK